MAAPDIYHHVVKNALIKEGWTITHDPYILTFGQRNVFVDLGAERLAAAERNHEKIAAKSRVFMEYLTYAIWKWHSVNTCSIGHSSPASSQGGRCFWLSLTASL